MVEFHVPMRRFARHLLTLAIAALASALPARRALRVQPAVALRQE
jgi:ABC-type lipoprotein release transport system permease subunit